jgi:acyl carrier protein
MIASRTPEGFPSQCPVCGASANIEYSPNARDAVCPNCGTLLWQASALLDRLFDLFGEPLGVSRENFTADTVLDFVNAPHDSLDTVELVMRLEESFDLEVSEDEMSRLRTVGDLIRFLQERLKGGDWPGPE